MFLIHYGATENLQVVKATQDRIPVFLDGGIRRGTDVFKALALGASGVFVSAKGKKKISHHTFAKFKKIMTF